MNWKNNRNIFVLISLLSITLTCFAQDDIKKEVNNIKKNSEYIWGEASGEDEEMGYELAHDKFITKLKAYIASNPELSKAEGVILPKIEQSEQKLVFNRTLEITVVCVYIKKDDLIPLYRQNSKDDDLTILAPKESKINEKTKPLIDQQTKGGDIPTEKVFQLVNERTIKQESQEVVTQDLIVSKPEKKEAVPAISTPVQQNNPQNLFSTNVGNKAKTILADLSSQGNYNNNIKYLNDRKTAEHDIMFKGYKTFTNNEGYWLIYDKNRNLVAILDSAKQTDLLSNMKVSAIDYANSPKVWLYIYE